MTNMTSRLLERSFCFIIEAHVRSSDLPRFADVSLMAPRWYRWSFPCQRPFCPHEDTIKHVPGILWLQYCMFVYTIHYRYIDQQMIPRVLDSSGITLRDPRHDKARCQRLGIGLDSWCSFASFDTGIVGWNMDQHYSSFMFFCGAMKLDSLHHLYSCHIYIYIIYVSFS